MHRRHALALLAAMLLAAPAAADTLYVLDTNDGFLNLRAGPGTTYGIIERLTGGQIVDRLGSSGEWDQVRLSDGRTGWAHSGYMGWEYRPQRAYDLMVVRTNDGYLNLRSGPGTNYGIVRRLNWGQRLFFLEERGSWFRVSLPEGTSGWASARYLTPAW
ncbi:SH3 domain-containing protein [Wenxinia marina]|uniref:SH3 domain protein n=1 Tax=Wenxinia marina DSM 24838 TaxID=1123501 RepID=A0A0D0PCU1_9RHOB|nr:SH3 domain-containing protein [Wenxinia marina]KIQ69201.1 SH3 domain protein [Wenxinia marina DSM 24838]GGL71124.1 hypothetical protein GCM10011392_27100 [Wenxinia marina]